MRDDIRDALPLIAVVALILAGGVLLAAVFVVVLDGHALVNGWL